MKGKKFQRAKGGCPWGTLRGRLVGTRGGLAILKSP
jgi:hypothetical protein